MQTYIPTKDELETLISDVFEKTAKRIIPTLVREATNKPFLTKDELKELTGWSDRTIQNLRDTRQIPFSQHGRKILYPFNGIIEFLNKNHIKPLR